MAIITSCSRRASNLLMNRQLMTTSRASGTHLDRTVNSKRSEKPSILTVSRNLLLKVNPRTTQVCSEAIVVGIDQLSPTVKGYRLKVLNREVTFKPGQWVDVTIPDIDTVGGFSMCSTPLALRTEGTLELAVKQSDHPPAQWMHEDCRVSSCLQLRVGGDFVYDPGPGGPITNLLLVAGGVGINPLLAMLKHHGELLDSGYWSSAVSPPKAYLLYSAKETDELLFKKEIDQLVLTHCNLVRGKYFLTQEEPKLKSPSIQQGRIGKPDLLEALDFLGRELTNCYLCGPPPLIDSVRSNLVDAGIPEQQIQFEKWW